MTIGSSRPFRSHAASALLFLVIPVTFVIAVASLTKAKGPQWLPYSFENPYSYLFNSLLLLKGQAPYSIDHPGTTTQVLGAVVLRASSLKSNDDLIAAVIRSPERYIRLLHWTLLILTVLVLWLAPWLTAQALNNQTVGILIQAPSLFYSSLLYYGILFGPDLMVVPFSIAAVCCCTLLLIPSRSTTSLAILLGIGDDLGTSASPRSIRIPLIPALTGLICALGIATKLTFFPLVLISLLYCRSKKNLLAFTFAFFFGLALALLPIYSQLLRLVTWVFSLGIHSGKYDSGAIGLPQSSVYLSSLSNLVRDEPLIIIIPIVATAVTLAFSFATRKQTVTIKVAWRTALVLFAIQVISLLLIAKESGTHYLIPLFLTAGLNLIFLFQACRSVESWGLKRAVGWIALASLVALGFKSFVETTPATYAQLKEDKIALLRLYKHAREVTKNGVRVDYFFSDSPVYPLCYGNDYAGGAFGSLLDGMYPNALFFNVFNGKFQTFTKFIDRDIVLNQYDHLYFLGNPKWLPKVDGFDPAGLETIDQSGGYCLQKWTRK
jgi:hypothetical protein